MRRTVGAGSEVMDLNVGGANDCFDSNLATCGKVR